MPNVELTEVEINDLRAANRMRAVDPAGHAAWVARHAPPVPGTQPKHARDMTLTERRAALKARGVTLPR